MKDLSYHVLDIVQNSLNAGASSIGIEITEDTRKGRLCLSIEDDGCGMTQENLNKVTDPFYTTSGKKKVGLGLPLLKQNAEITGGAFHISSFPEKGTRVIADFNASHIDMIPLGDIALTFRTLIAANPERNFAYVHTKAEEGFRIDTAELRRELDEVDLDNRDVLEYITVFIRENLKALSTGLH